MNTPTTVTVLLPIEGSDRELAKVMRALHTQNNGTLYAVQGIERTKQEVVRLGTLAFVRSIDVVRQTIQLASGHRALVRVICPLAS